MTSFDPVTGVDVVTDSRVEALDTTRVLREEERRLGRDASVFALKEAALKACGLQPGSWKDVKVSYESGQPTVDVRGFKGSLACSVSHENGSTVAVVHGLRFEEEDESEEEHSPHE